MYRMQRQFLEDFFGSDVVVMPKPRFIQEHKKLLQVLEKKDPKELEAEKKDQAKELKSYMKKAKSKKAKVKDADKE